MDRTTVAIALTMFASPLVLAAEGRAQDQDDPHHVSDEDNSGQDPTKPLTRIDLRYKYRDNEGHSTAHIFTFRADKPFALGGGWKLSTRIDAPFMLTDAPTTDNPFGESRFGASDVLTQALIVTPPMGRFAFAFGTQLIFSSASDTQFGSGKYQLAPSIAAIAQIPEISRGTFAGLLVRNQFSFAGRSNRPKVNDFVIEPILNIALPDRWFVTFAPEIRLDLMNGGRAFVPFDITIGKKITKDIVISVQADVPIVNQYRQYDMQVEFRIGFFF